MVDLLFIEDDDLQHKPGISKSLFDPACGTGGMLSVAEDRLRALNPRRRAAGRGPGTERVTYAICRSDMMFEGQGRVAHRVGNSFIEDGFEGETFDYLLAIPFGVEWKRGGGRRWKTSSRASGPRRASPDALARACRASKAAYPDDAGEAYATDAAECVGAAVRVVGSAGQFRR